jgi:glycosyltransferase involved in cell wall biosynthesis
MGSGLNSKRIAIIHDWLYTYGGAERVLEQMLAVFPNADVYSMFEDLRAEERNFLGDRQVRTSFLQKSSFVRRHHRAFLPIMPLAVEQFDLSAYDIVISSCYAIAKGVITGPDQLHVSYVHSPMRYAWDMQHEYLAQAKLTSGPKSWAARLLLHKMRMWDLRTANGVDVYLANSEFVARRIRKIYRREAQIVYPPIPVEEFKVGESRDDFYITVSRLVPYKRVDFIVDAFNAMPDRRLMVIGTGPEADRIVAKAKSNVQLMGYQPNSVVHDYMSRARAFIFAAEEDFGIVMLESLACGTPVIAYGRGGALEIIRDVTDPMPTGMFFHNRDTIDGLCSAIRLFEASAERFQAKHCRQQAVGFNTGRFREEFRVAVEQADARFRTQEWHRRRDRAPETVSA